MRSDIFFAQSKGLRTISAPSSIPSLLQMKVSNDFSEIDYTIIE